MSLNRSIATSVIIYIALIVISILPSITFALGSDGINYQAIARDANGNVLENTQITVQFSIIPDSPTNASVYQEIHDQTPISILLQTNDYGLFNLIIGRGVRNGGTLNSFELYNVSKK